MDDFDGIFDAGGALIPFTFNDDGGTDLNSQLEFVAASSGTYYIAAGAYGSHTGTYTLSLADLGGIDDYPDTTATWGTVAVGGSTNGNIEEARDEDWFGVNLSGSHTYQIDLEGVPTGGGTLPDPFLRGIHDAGGALVEVDR